MHTQATSTSIATRKRNPSKRKAPATAKPTALSATPAATATPPPSLDAVLALLDPSMLALAQYAYGESRRRGLIDERSTFERWLLDGIYERAQLVAECFTGLGPDQGEQAMTLRFTPSPILAVNDGPGGATGERCLYLER